MNRSTNVPRLYDVTLRHDGGGSITVTTTASTPEAAVRIVCAEERAPWRAAVKVVETPTPSTARCECDHIAAVHTALYGCWHSTGDTGLCTCDYFTDARFIDAGAFADVRISVELSDGAA